MLCAPAEVEPNSEEGTLKASLGTLELELNTDLFFLRIPHLCGLYAVVREGERMPLDWWTEERTGARRFTWRSLDVTFDGPKAMRRGQSCRRLEATG
jgi:hypothetical protein